MADDDQGSSFASLSIQNPHKMSRMLLCDPRNPQNVMVVRPPTRTMHMFEPVPSPGQVRSLELFEAYDHWASEAENKRHPSTTDDLIQSLKRNVRHVYGERRVVNFPAILGHLNFSPYLRTKVGRILSVRISPDATKFRTYGGHLRPASSKRNQLDASTRTLNCIEESVQNVRISLSSTNQAGSVTVLPLENRNWPCSQTVRLPRLNARPVQRGGSKTKVYEITSRTLLNNSDTRLRSKKKKYDSGSKFKKLDQHK